MINFQSYKVGEKFPEPEIIPDHTGALPIFTDAGFECNCFLDDITEREAEDFSTGELKISLYLKVYVPFIVFQLGKHLMFDVSFNILKNTEEFNKKWLLSKSNIVNLFLIDYETHILKAIRTVSFPKNIMVLLRTSLIAQKDHYEDIEIIDRVIFKITDEYSIQQIQKKSKINYTFE